MSNIFLGMIARNEARDIGRCLASAKDCCDGLVLIDTGSTDNTLEVAHEVWPKDKPFLACSFTGASEYVKDNWRIKDFSKARNKYLELIENLNADWVLCLDADDELLTPEVVREGVSMENLDVFSVWIKDGGAKWVTHRLWRAKMGIRFEGRCHEYPKLTGRHGHLDRCVIEHHAEPAEGQENANRRNLRILVDEWNEDGPKPRTAFYMANTHRDGQRWPEAAHWYKERIRLGEHYRDEWLFAHLYLIRCLREIGNINEAQWYLSQAISNAHDWCEFLMEYAAIAYNQQQWQTAIDYATRAFEQPIPTTALWREPNAYGDAPARLISWCYEMMGKVKEALEWAKEAKRKIGVPDQEWDDRISRLSHIMMVDPQYA